MSWYIVPLIVYSLVGLQILCFKIKLEKKNTYDKTKGNQILPYLHVSAISIYSDVDRYLVRYFKYL